MELVKHLSYMEQRWFVWGFAGEQVPAPFGDEDEDGRWHLDADESSADLIAALHAGGERTRAIVTNAHLSDTPTTGGRFAESETRPTPTLAWILAYVVQEYARPAGHLDIVRELIDDTTGERARR